MTKRGKNKIAILFLSLFVIGLALFCDNYYKEKTVSINADGKGYYDYLPALFIYNDIQWNYLDTLETEFYNHKEYSSIINEVEGGKVNKYFIGTAICELPFFLSACLYETFKGYQIDGYSKTFQDAIRIAGIFYLWLGLLFLLLFFRKLEFSWIAISITLVVITMATPLMHYFFQEPSFSHVYSFAVVSAFLYFSYNFYCSKKKKHLFITAILLGFIFLIRPVNVLIVLIFCFYFDSWKALLQFWRDQIKFNLKSILLAIALILCIIFIQPIFWYLQTENFLVDAYTSDYTFNFLSPEIINVLFSYKKGLFIYTPVLFILLLGTYYYLKNKQYYKIGVLLFTLFLITYVISSWSCWYYGMSYGHRAFIEFLPLFAIFGIYLFSQTRIFGKIVLSVFYTIFIFINIIQIDQYNRNILHWDQMDKDSYWKVFLNTDKRYEGLLWLDKLTYRPYQAINQFSFNVDNQFQDDYWLELLNVNRDSIPDLPNCDALHLKLDADIDTSESIIYFSVDDSSGNNLIWLQQTSFFGFNPPDIYKENTKGIANYYFKFQLPPDFYFLKMGMYIKKGTVSVNNAMIKLINTNKFDPEELQRMEDGIRANEQWLNEVKIKAKERNISVDEMIRIDAEYILRNNL